MATKFSRILEKRDSRRLLLLGAASAIKRHPCIHCNRHKITFHWLPRVPNVCATTFAHFAKSKNRFVMAAIDRLPRYLVATNVATNKLAFHWLPRVTNICATTFAHFAKIKNRFAMAAIDMADFHVTWLQLMHVLSHISLICTGRLPSIWGRCKWFFGQAHLSLWFSHVMLVKC